MHISISDTLTNIVDELNENQHALLKAHADRVIDSGSRNVHGVDVPYAALTGASAMVLEDVELTFTTDIEDHRPEDNPLRFLFRRSASPRATEAVVKARIKSTPAQEAMHLYTDVETQLFKDTLHAAAWKPQRSS